MSHVGAPHDPAALPGLGERLACDGSLSASASRLLEELAEAAGPYVPPPPISNIVIPTRDRPSLLGRALASYIRNTKHFGRTCDFVIMDDSRAAKGREANWAFLRDLPRREGVVIRYAGIDEKRRFAASLSAESGVAERVVDFAIFGMAGFDNTCGANRNAALLHTIGDSLLSVDDDTVCQIAAPPVQRRELSLDSRGLPAWDHWFYSSREDVLRDLSMCDRDVLSIHEEALGKRLDICVAERGYRADLRHMSASLLDSTLMHADGRILSTMNGLFGDGGYESPLVSFNGPSLDRLVASERVYRAAVASMEMVRAVPGTTLTMRAPVAGGFLGLDNRDFLPPFMPVARGEDTIFGALQSRCHPGSMQALLPSLLLHAPAHARVRERDAILVDAMAPRTPILVLSALSHFHASRASSGRARLRAMGAALFEFASLPPREFCAELHGFVSRTWRRILERYDVSLEERGHQPSYWAADVERLCRTVKAHFVHPEYIVPAELRSGCSADDALRLLQRTFVALGELLDAWPALIDAARALRSRGERLAIPVQQGSTP